MLARSPRRTSLVLLCALAVLVPGCARVIDGQGQTTDGVRPNVAPSNLEIVGSGDEEVDTVSRNALADLETFWEETFPEVYGAEFQPVAGGYYSVDPANFDPDDYPDDIGCFEDVEDVEDNAFYCFPQPSGGDNIVYDRTLLAALAEEYGRFIPALVMAHEFGHAIQGREAPPSDLSIVFETQADCFAGAWTGWVADDNAEHFLVRPSELDDVLRGYLLLRDAPGSAPTEPGAHGSYFDRVSAFQEGYEDGAEACRNNYTDDRVFTLSEFSSLEDLENDGNAPYDAPEGDVFEITEVTLENFWSQAFDEIFDTEWTAPTLQPFAGNRPECDGARQRRDVTYCQGENRVDFDDGELMPTVYEEIGDFAVTTLLAVQYAAAARDQLGLDFRGEDALRSNLCLTGWYSARFLLDGETLGAIISPGDLDEAVQVLLEYGNQPNVLPDVGLSGFQAVDLFRQGFLDGASACDIGA